MLKQLLIERFNLRVHVEPRLLTSYNLVVGRDGPKFTKSSLSRSELLEANPKGQYDQKSMPQIDKEGFPILRGTTSLSWTQGKARWGLPDATIAELAKMLSGQLGQLVIDTTHLTGTYDMTLTWVADNHGRTAEAEFSGPTLFEALSKQLGLRLERTKATVDVIVIDHTEKMPLEN